LAGSAGAAMAILMAAALVTVASRPTMATPDIARTTGQACSKCHTAPPALNGYGKKYKDGLKR
jgi:hypothetical protein